MARLWTSGFEWNNIHGDGYPIPSGTIGGTGINSITLNSATFSSTSPRTGTYALRQTTASQTTLAFPGALATTYYLRAYIRLSALPASVIGTVVGIGGASPVARINVNADGSLDLKTGSAGGTLVGSTVAGAIGTGAYYMVEVAVQTNSGSLDDYAEARLNGVSFASVSSATISIAAPTTLFFAASDGTVTTDTDDVALNDTSGANQTSWPGSGRIVLLRPISLNANGGSWTDDNNATTSAALTNPLDNAPPAGIADTTSGGGDHNVRNAAANSSLDMNLATYASAGVGATDIINVLVPSVAVGAPSATGAKSGSFGTTTNPAITNRVFTSGSGTATFFWRGAAAGTYLTNWGWEIGTVTYAPAVTVGSSPIGRLTITGGTTTRIAMCCAMGLYVDFTPAGALPFLPFRQASTLYKI